jgi:hypothetical protein
VLAYPKIEFEEAWLSLLRDMLPDPMWSKRGGTDRDGSVLTVRRARVLAASLAVREVVIASFYFVTFLFSSRSDMVLWLIVSLGLLVWMIFDNDRRCFFASMMHSLLLTDRVRIGIVLAFIAPFVLYIGLKALVRLDFVFVDLVQADFVIAYLATLCFLLLLFYPALAEGLKGREAALTSTDADMETTFARTPICPTKAAANL